jgi:ribosomal protein S18 acetylase RimI-like enzyme
LTEGARPRYPTVELLGPERDRAIAALKESFTGIYRWHAKRTLREISTVRAVEDDREVVDVSMTELLDADVAYVYYLFVAAAHRGRGIASTLLDEAIERFAGSGAEVVYAACEEENLPSLRLFSSRGFRTVGRKETGFREGGLGAWGYQSRMRLVRGELLLGRRLRSRAAGR